MKKVVLYLFVINDARFDYTVVIFWITSNTTPNSSISVVDVCVAADYSAETAIFFSISSQVIKQWKWNFDLDPSTFIKNNKYLQNDKL